MNLISDLNIFFRFEVTLKEGLFGIELLRPTTLSSTYLADFILLITKMFENYVIIKTAKTGNC